MQLNSLIEGNLKPRIATIALISLVALAIGPVSILLGVAWSDTGDRYGHGWLILAISLYLLWRPTNAQVERLVGVEFWLVAALLVGTVAVQILALVMTIQVIMMNLIPVALIFGCYLAFGRSYALFTFFPLAYLYCALPIWNYINPSLQSMTSLVVSNVLGWSGISIFIQGNFITIPAGVFEVAEGCSGFKYFISSLSLSLLFAHLYANSKSQQALIVGMGLLLALIANWVRVYVVIMIAHFTDITNPLVEDHDNLGWVIYGISLIPFFITANFIVNKNSLETDVEKVDGVSAKESDNFAKLSWKEFFLKSRLIECSLLLVSIFGLFNVHREFVLTEQQTSVFKMSEWNNSGAKKNSWDPVFETASEYESRDNVDNKTGAVFRYHVAKFQTFPWQSDPWFYLNSVESKFWKLETESIVELESGYQVREQVLKNRFGSRVVAYQWYQVGDEWIVGKIPFKLAVLKSYLNGFYGSQYYAISSYCSRVSCDKSAEVLRSKLAEFHEGKS